MKGENSINTKAQSPYRVGHWPLEENDDSRPTHATSSPRGEPLRDGRICFLYKAMTAGNWV